MSAAAVSLDTVEGRVLVDKALRVGFASIGITNDVVFELNEAAGRIDGVSFFHLTIERDPRGGFVSKYEPETPGRHPDDRSEVEKIEFDRAPDLLSAIKRAISLFASDTIETKIDRYLSGVDEFAMEELLQQR